MLDGEAAGELHPHLWASVYLLIVEAVVLLLVKQHRAKEGIEAALDPQLSLFVGEPQMVRISR